MTDPNSIFGRPSKIRTAHTGYIRKPDGCTQNALDRILDQLVVEKVISSWGYDQPRDLYVLRQEV